MLIAVFDFETTGLDRLQDRVLEVGALLYSTGHKRVLMAEDFLIDNEVPIPAEATEVNHIKKGMTDKFGLVPNDGLLRLQNYFDQADTIAGKNIIDFDIPFYENWCLREGEEVIKKPTIDIETDLPGTKSKHLGYMAADDGFLNPFPHAALPDAWTTLRLIESKIEKLGKDGLELIMQRAASPRVTIKAHVSFDDNYKAKKRGYAWNSDRKVWFKNIKLMDLELEGKEAPFDISQIEPIPTH
jgi:DNA polymerase III epsilon subunit-like protein